MQTINKQIAGDALAMENLAELHKVRERIRLFESKYETTFEQFEQQVFRQKENFQHYDDYIDWKAAVKWRKELEQRIEELKHRSFEVA